MCTSKTDKGMIHEELLSENKKKKKAKLDKKVFKKRGSLNVK